MVYTLQSGIHRIVMMKCMHMKLRAVSFSITILRYFCLLLRTEWSPCAQSCPCFSPLVPNISSFFPLVRAPVFTCNNSQSYLEQASPMLVTCWTLHLCYPWNYFAGHCNLYCCNCASKWREACHVFQIKSLELLPKCQLISLKSTNPNGQNVKHHN